MNDEELRDLSRQVAAAEEQASKLLEQRLAAIEKELGIEVPPNKKAGELE